jgi:hypothetical protein
VTAAKERTMNPKPIVAMTALLAALQGCASTAELEARQLAWRGPSSGPCLFGGVTSRSVQHCARVDFGDEALMQAVNTQVLRWLGRPPPLAEAQGLDELFAGLALSVASRAP